MRRDTRKGKGVEGFGVRQTVAESRRESGRASGTGGKNFRIPSISTMLEKYEKRTRDS